MRGDRDFRPSEDTNFQRPSRREAVAIAPLHLGRKGWRLGASDSREDLRHGSAVGSRWTGLMPDAAVTQQCDPHANSVGALLPYPTLIPLPSPFQPPSDTRNITPMAIRLRTSPRLASPRHPFPLPLHLPFPLAVPPPCPLPLRLSTALRTARRRDAVGAFAMGAGSAWRTRAQELKLILVTSIDPAAPAYLDLSEADNH